MGPLATSEIKGATPIAADPGGFSDLWTFRKMWILVIFRWDLGSGRGLQCIGNGCGLQMDGFSTHFEPSDSIFSDFHDFGHFESIPVV